MPPPSRRSTSLLRAAEISLAAALFGAPLALGGAPRWTLAPLVALACAAAAFTLWAARKSRQDLRLPELAWLWPAALALLLLQLVPLPGFLLSALSPEAADVRAFVLEPLGIARPTPVSLDPAGTWRELAKLAAYALLFLAACELARSGRFRGQLVALVALAGALVAAIGVGHLLLFEPPQSLFGVRVFRLANSPLPAPIGNPNHLAAFLSLGATCSLALLLDRGRSTRAWLWAPAYLLTGAAVFLTLSRGGVASFVAAQAVLVALIAGRPTEEGAHTHRAGVRIARWRLSAGAVAAIAIVAAVAVYAGYDRILAEIRTVDTAAELEQSKLELWPMFARAAGEFPLVGMGRGAFAAAFTRYQSTLPDVVFTHAENWPLHLAAELGIAPALLLVGFGGWLVWRRLRRRPMDLLARGALAALVGVAFHDLFDYSLEAPATAVSACVLLAVLASERRSPDSPRAPRLAPVLRGRWGFSPVLAGGALAALGLIAARGRSAEEIDARLDAAVASATSAADLLAGARDAVDARPADFFVHARLADAFSAPPHRDPGLALAFANRALFLRPLDAGAHTAAARALLATGRRTQAMLEYRLASAAAGRAPEPLIEGIAAARSQPELESLGGHDPATAHAVAHYLRNAGRRAEARDYLGTARLLLETAPDRAAVARLFALSAELELDEGRTDPALALVERAERIDPASARVPILHAAVLSAMGRAPQAVAVLEAALSRHPGDLELSVELAHALSRLGDRHTAREVLGRAAPLLHAPADRLRVTLLESRLFREEGRLQLALDRCRVAAQIDPASPSPRYAAAEILEQLGRFADAVREIEAGMRIEGGARPDRRAWADRLDARRRELASDSGAPGGRGL